VKNILFILSLFAAFSACQTRPEGVVITGSLTNSLNEKVLLEELGIQQAITVDSTTVNEEGNFVLISQIKNKGFYRLGLNQNNFIILILDSGETVSITGDAQNLAESYRVSGSKDSELLWELNNTFKENYRRRDSIQQAFQEYMYHPQRDSIARVLEAEFQATVENLEKYIKSFIENNPASFASLAALERLNPDKDLEYFLMVRNNLAERYPESPYVKTLHNRVEEMAQLAIGATAPEISQRNPEGNMVSLSDLRGQVVLIDFWASWCRPCREENPNIIRLYNRFKDQGFEILGVSLDDNKDAWVNAIRDDNLPWKHVSDLQGRNSIVGAKYQVAGIPYTVIVDREGKIIAKGLRGPELEQKLEQVLN
jgi:peroxiredoxin